MPHDFPAQAHFDFKALLIMSTILIKMHPALHHDCRSCLFLKARMFYRKAKFIYIRNCVGTKSYLKLLVLGTVFITNATFCSKMLLNFVWILKT